MQRAGERKRERRGGGGGRGQVHTSAIEWDVLGTAIDTLPRGVVSAVVPTLYTSPTVETEAWQEQEQQEQQQQQQQQQQISHGNSPYGQSTTDQLCISPQSFVVSSLPDQATWTCHIEFDPGMVGKGVLVCWITSIRKRSIWTEN